MAQIIIDIPDDLAQQLAPFQDQFTELFTRLIASPLLGRSISVESSSGSSTINATGAYQEILDFLISRPTSQQVINFQVSESSQSRLQELLQKNRENTIDSAGLAELDLYEQIDTLMGLLKVRAYAINTSK